MFLLCSLSFPAFFSFFLAFAVYVRGPNHEDLSLILDKVVFSLHPSFAQPVRELTEPPFAVSEMGWGEFEASIRLFFKYALFSVSHASRNGS